ncbi:MAG: NUDIX hydrolase [candidate division Zixibacteria bacterium]|nr:NUDIX hydrolase [candidate division Zixibacteria bacterium]MBU1472018.1 NUDIX hydrolase [candidate division Zixibacteria bacterium]MBU2624041.1 NUDIX hydrolase [candidate division Zixibacteria bacterium]
MFVTPEIIAEIEKQYGKPEERSARFEMSVRHFANLKSSQKNGRSHDVTLFIRKDDKFVVIAKHFYPPGLYRPPSGGINPGEGFVDGAKREAKEETGCDVELVRYLMRVSVEFFCGAEAVDWTSHVFLADYISGVIKPLDTVEIREIALAGIDKFLYFKELLLASDSGGMHYRAYLHDEILKIL